MGYFVGTWGNVSARVPQGLIVTPSKVAYDTMTIDDMVTLSLTGTVISGHRLPTSEAEIHRSIYIKRDDIGAAIHSHSTYATAVSCLRKPIPPIVEDLTQIIGGAVPCAEYCPAGQHKKLGEYVVHALGDVNAVLVANHGVVCCGKDLQEALVACQIVEKAACIFLSASSQGRLAEIEEQFIRSERNRYLYKYGTKNDAP
jgi:L-fuculose-phosphate aldolase